VGRAEEPTPARVTVIKPRVVLKIGEKIVDHAEFGDNFFVARIEGDRVWITGGTASLARVEVMPYDEAIDYYTARLQMDRSAENYEARGAIWLGRGEYGIAVGDFTDALALRPRHPSTLLRGVAWRNLVGHARSEAGRQAGNMTGTEVGNALSRAVTAAAGQKEKENALADFNEAIRLDPQNPVAYAVRGDYWREYHDADSMERAIADYSEAIRRDPKLLRAYEARSLAYAWKTDYAKEQSDLTAAIQLDPDSPHHYFRRGKSLVTGGNSEAAIADFQIALKIDPTNAAVLVARANLYKQLNDVEKFLADAE